MTVSTFFPDADPETTSVDGHVIENTPAIWATIRGALTGDLAFDSAPLLDVLIRADAIINLWDIFGRAFALFDTSSLPDGDDISAATLEFALSSAAGFFNDDFSDSVSMVTSTPASDIAIVVGDYDQVGTIKQAADLTLASLTVDEDTYNVMTLNAVGLGNISKTGVSKFGLRLTSDNDNNEPPWVANDFGRIALGSSEETFPAGDRRIKLVVTHDPPPPVAPGLPEYGQGRAAIGDPSVYGSTIVRS